MHPHAQISGEMRISWWKFPSTKSTCRHRNANFGVQRHLLNEDNAFKTAASKMLKFPAFKLKLEQDASRVEVSPTSTAREGNECPCLHDAFTSYARNRR